MPQQDSQELASVCTEMWLRMRAFLLFELEIGCTMRSIVIWKTVEKRFSDKFCIHVWRHETKTPSELHMAMLMGNLRPVTDNAARVQIRILTRSSYYWQR